MLSESDKLVRATLNFQILLYFSVAFLHKATGIFIFGLALFDVLANKYMKHRKQRNFLFSLYVSPPASKR